MDLGRTGGGCCRCRSREIWIQAGEIAVVSLACVALVSFIIYGSAKLMQIQTIHFFERFELLSNTIAYCYLLMCLLMISANTFLVHETRA